MDMISPCFYLPVGLIVLPDCFPLVWAQISIYNLYVLPSHSRKSNLIYPILEYIRLYHQILMVHLLKHSNLCGGYSWWNVAVLDMSSNVDIKYQSHFEGLSKTWPFFYNTTPAESMLDIICGVTKIACFNHWKAHPSHCMLDHVVCQGPSVYSLYTNHLQICIVWCTW